jgi:hypothetical protein
MVPVGVEDQVHLYYAMAGNTLVVVGFLDGGWSFLPVPNLDLAAMAWLRASLTWAFILLFFSKLGAEATHMCLCFHGNSCPFPEILG